MPNTLLIVDDEPLNLAVLTQILQPYYKVRAVNSGSRCLAAAAPPQTPDLILLDVMMPEMDGYEVLSQLYSNPATCDIPVIFVTALNDEIDEAHGLELGAADYITKPVRSGIVLARIRTQLELKAARDRLKDQNTWLEAEVARRTEEVMAVQDVGIHALAELAETRDPETGNHIKRTQEYIATLAAQLRKSGRYQVMLSDSYINLLIKSAPLHDIGKVGIPDAILLKPGRLTAEEMVVMRTHSELGAAAIGKAVRSTGKPVPFLELAQEIAHWHHEKWDGSGYPDGLAGEAIPFSARLMAVADVYDALISKRVYKPPMRHCDAVEIICNAREKHFDPDVVDCFVKLTTEFHEIALKFGD